MISTIIINIIIMFRIRKERKRETKIERKKISSQHHSHTCV